MKIAVKYEIKNGNVVLFDEYWDILPSNNDTYFKDSLDLGTMTRILSIALNSIAALCFLSAYAVASPYEMGEKEAVSVNVEVVDLVEVDDYCAQDPMPEGCVIGLPATLKELKQRESEG